MIAHLYFIITVEFCMLFNSKIIIIHNWNVERNLQSQRDQFCAPIFILKSFSVHIYILFCILVTHFLQRRWRKLTKPEHFKKFALWNWKIANLFSTDWYRCNFWFSNFCRDHILLCQNSISANVTEIIECATVNGFLNY